MKESSRKAVVAFVPVIHKGYIDFFSTYEGDIYVWGKDLIEKFVHLTRDLRTIDPEQAVKALQTIFPDRIVKVLHEADLADWKYTLTTMPDDEVCHSIAEEYLSGKKVEFVSVFLRWNKVITFTENEVPAHRKISIDGAHRELIQKANKEAEKSGDWWRQIAALIVKDGKIVEQTHNHHMPTDFHLSVNGDPRSNFDAGQHQNVYTSIHAEAEAIAKAAKEGISLDGASLFVTTFPCPNCARLAATAGIKKIYYSKGYSLLDAEKILEHFGVEIILVK